MSDKKNAGEVIAAGGSLKAQAVARGVPQTSDPSVKRVYTAGESGNTKSADPHPYLDRETGLRYSHPGARISSNKPWVYAPRPEFGRKRQ